ncbi:MAG: BMC domain-containing protein [Candidatus Wallbacteria bacterium]|nr:BMC domain-containing protein [Candidatus Wallbacteria bacterium]
MPRSAVPSRASRTPSSSSPSESGLEEETPVPDIYNAIGMIELSSIATGYNVQDAMLKAADVKLLVARTICSGKYMVLCGGDVAAVTASVGAGADAAGRGLIDRLVIPNVHPQVFPALAGTVELKHDTVGALGILESFSVVAGIQGADAAVKTSDVTLFRLHAAMAIGGKAYMLLTGSVADVTAAVEAGAQTIGELGMLVSKQVIPRPRAELFRDFI